MYASPGTEMEILAGTSLSKYLTTHRDEKKGWDFDFDLNNPYHPHILTTLDTTLDGKDIQLDIDINLGPDSDFHDPPTMKQHGLIGPPQLERHQSVPLSITPKPLLKKVRSYSPWSQYLPEPSAYFKETEEKEAKVKEKAKQCTKENPGQCAKMSGLCTPLPDLNTKTMVNPCYCRDNRCYYDPYQKPNDYTRLLKKSQCPLIKKGRKQYERDHTILTRKFDARIENITRVGHPEIVEKITKNISLTRVLKTIMENVQTHKTKFGIYSERPIKVHLIACLLLTCNPSCPENFECRETECKDYLRKDWCVFGSNGLCSWKNKECILDRDKIVKQLTKRCKRPLFYDDENKKQYWEKLSDSNLADKWSNLVYTNAAMCFPFEEAIKDDNISFADDKQYINHLIRAHKIRSQHKCYSLGKKRI